MCKPGSPAFCSAPEHDTHADTTSLLLCYLPGSLLCSLGILPLSQPGCTVTITLCNLESGGNINAHSLCWSSAPHLAAPFSTTPACRVQFYCSLQGSLHVLNPSGNRRDLWFQTVKNGSIFSLPDLCWLHFKGPNKRPPSEDVVLSTEVEADRWLPEVGHCYHLPALLCQL